MTYCDPREAAFIASMPRSLPVHVHLDLCERRQDGDAVVSAIVYFAKRRDMRMMSAALKAFCRMHAAGVVMKTPCVHAVSIAVGCTTSSIYVGAHYSTTADACFNALRAAASIVESEECILGADITRLYKAVEAVARRCTASTGTGAAFLCLRTMLAYGACSTSACDAFRTLLGILKYCLKSDTVRRIVQYTTAAEAALRSRAALCANPLRDNGTRRFLLTASDLFQSVS